MSRFNELAGLTEGRQPSFPFSRGRKVIVSPGTKSGRVMVSIDAEPAEGFSLVDADPATAKREVDQFVGALQKAGRSLQKQVREARFDELAGLTEDKGKAFKYRMDDAHGAVKVYSDGRYASVEIESDYPKGSVRISNGSAHDVARTEIEVLIKALKKAKDSMR